MPRNSRAGIGESQLLGGCRSGLILIQDTHLAGSDGPKRLKLAPSFGSKSYKLNFCPRRKPPGAKLCGECVRNTGLNHSQNTLLCPWYDPEAVVLDFVQPDGARRRLRG